MVTVFINKEDTEYLFDGVWTNLQEKSNSFLRAWSIFIDLHLDRHFIIFSETDFDLTINHLQFSQLKRNGKIHIKNDKLENNLDLAEQQRCIIFNSNDSQTNKKNSALDNCIHSNVRDDDQFIACVENLFETKISPIKSFSKNNLADFPYIKLPVRSFVFYDPYFPKVNRATSKIELSKVVDAVTIFASKLLSKISIPNIKDGVNIIFLIKEGKTRHGGYYSPVGEIADKGNLKELEDKINLATSKVNASVSFVLGNKEFHDRGFYSEYFQIINTNSIHDKSATLVQSGILRDSFGYFSNLKILNSICNNQLDHLTDQYTMLNRLNLS